MNKYLKAKYGDYPVVISVPHGGYLRPVSIPNRKTGCFIKDNNVISLLKYINNEFLNRNIKISYVYSSISRKKLDLNRSKYDGCESKRSEENWAEYHNTINEMIKRLVKKHNQVLYIDLHGQSTRDFVELGYAHKLTKSQFAKNSFGGHLEINGIDSYPSPKRKNMLGRYRNGGYSVRRHHGYKIDAIQVEVNRGPRMSVRKEKDFAERFVKAIINYIG